MKMPRGNWWKPTIRKQLVLSVTVVHAVLMLIFIVGLVNRQHSFLLERVRERTLHQAEMLAASAVPQLTTNDLAGLAEIVGSLSHDPSIRFAMVTDAHGRLLGHSDPKHSGQYLNDEISQKHLRQGGPGGVVYQGKDMVESVAPVAIEDSTLGWAWVAGDLRGINQQLTAVTRAGIVYACIAVVTGILLALLVASSTTRQLRLLLDGADRMARDDLDQPVPLTTWNEVGVLTRAFNRAMRELRKSRIALEQAHAELQAELIERRRAEQELQTANRAIQRANDNLRQFAHVASHDLKEPLRTVTGFGGLLLRKYKDKLDDQAKEYIEYIHSGAVRMQNLIQALLDYSRAGASSGEDVRPVDTTLALRTAQDNLSTAIDAARASIEASELPTVQAHEIAIVQLFQNLVSNAIKYSKERPLIRISAEPDAGYWTFRVADNGIGIEPRYYEHIFEIFRRVHADEYPGSGIGLAICKRIVERYGGRIWVESTYGQGSTFYFSLPAGQQ
jgi:signal transduction histidine kinase